MRAVAKNELVSNFLAPEQIIADYELACLSRAASVLGRKEVLSGRAKFGIFGDGKEVAQVALARFFAPGDWRSGYYRDQTLMFALQLSSVRQLFAQLYADTDSDAEPASAGRQMVCHFASRTHDQQGQARAQTTTTNTAADLSPVAAQMGRAVGLAYASYLYRQVEALHDYKDFSHNGNEIAFATIGDASTSEGIFWEALNAAGVLQIPLVTLVWDDNYGISVPTAQQTIKQSISKALAGFQGSTEQRGIDIYQVPGWDYNTLYLTFQRAIPKVRSTHTPALFHVTELTQPQGHSTSGSHERYKDAARLRYETERDCLRMFRQWLVTQNIATAAELEQCEQRAADFVQRERDAAWDNYRRPHEAQKQEVLNLYRQLPRADDKQSAAHQAIVQLQAMPNTTQRELARSLHHTLLAMRNESSDAIAQLRKLYHAQDTRLRKLYSSHLHCASNSALQVPEIAPVFASDEEAVDGRIIILRCFENLLERDPRFFAIGEDIGKLGGVNLCFQDLQEKFGVSRVTDTGIREATILGQGIGAALRGLRPLVDIQYLDYLLYCLQLLSDDLACLHYRTAGGQSAPVIIRTKGHRLEGIWHTGSMLGMVIHAVRGVHVCVPRNMVQAAGMYNTLARGNDPAIVIEVLNGYRRKERLPSNYREFTVPLGVPEIIRPGKDVTLLTYGACVVIAQDACEQLAQLGIEVELIDAQCLLPFDVHGKVVASLRQSNALVIVDEDVPGGASAWLLQQVLETHGGYDWLDLPPCTISGAAHRSPYGSDGDYYSKPNAEQICTTIYNLVRQRDPQRYPDLLNNRT